MIRRLPMHHHRVPGEDFQGIPSGSFGSALKLKGLVVVDGDQVGWKRILPATSLQSAAVAATQPGSALAGPAMPSPKCFILSMRTPSELTRSLSRF